MGNCKFIGDTCQMHHGAHYATLCDYAAGRSISSSAFAAGISTLVKNKLAEIQTGEVKASEALFLGAR